MADQKVETPKYTITGNTLGELLKQVASVVSRTQQVTVKEAQKGGYYAVWQSAVLTGGPEFAVTLPEDTDIPNIPGELAVTVVFKKLGTEEDMAVRAEKQRAATVTQINRLREQAERLGVKLEAPAVK